MTIRGGIGNQLFQIAALSYLARNFGCVPIVNDYDLSLSSRDKYQSQFRSLNLYDWFDWGNNLRLPNNYFQKILLRFFWRYTKNSKLIPIMSDDDLGSICSKHENSLASKSENDKSLNLDFDVSKGLFFLNGSFQDPKYVLDLPKFNTCLLLDVDEKIFQSEINANKESVAIHVRLTDFTNNLFEYKENIQSGLNKIGNKFHLFDWYTDDLQTSRKLLSSIQAIPSANFRFPDEFTDFDGTTLLKRLSTYSNYIPSQSSICWWAFFLAYNYGNEPNVFSLEGKFSEYKFKTRAHDAT